MSPAAADGRQTGTDSSARQPGGSSPGMDAADASQRRVAERASNQRTTGQRVASQRRAAGARQRAGRTGGRTASKPSRLNSRPAAVGEPAGWPLRLKRWLVSNDAFGYATSLVLHLVLLVLLSIVLVEEVGSGAFTTLASQSERERVEFDELLDTRMDLAGGETEFEQLPELTVVEAPDAELQLPIDTDLLLRDPGDSEGEAEEGDGPGTAFSPPSGGNAVTKGSFTVWAEPDNPALHEPYIIFIRVRLPKGKRHYRASDLSGIVLGTDAHEQRIPWDPRWPGAALKTKRSGDGQLPLRLNGYLPIKKRHALLMVRVPGSRIPKTEDTIEIESKLLKERQTLKIVFGTTRKQPLP